MNNEAIDCKLDAVQDLLKDLRIERGLLKKQLVELTAMKTDYDHLLNPRISSLPADKIAMIVSDYRRVLAERTDTKLAIEKIDRILGLKCEEVSNVPVNISRLKKKIYNIRCIKETFDCYSDFITGDCTYRGEKLK